MRTLMISFLLLATPASAEPAEDVDVQVTELTISGSAGIERSIVPNWVGDAVDTVQRCFIKSKPAKLAATVTLKFHIDNRGAITKPALVGFPSINACVASALKSMVFDVPSGGIDISVKMAFTPPVPQQQGGAFASLTGTGDISSGFDDTNIYGGLGNEPGDAKGGGGGIGWGTIGTGRYGTIGHGSGHATGTVAAGDPNATGDKQAIRDAIQKQVGKVQACYDRELVADPKLAGTVTVKFRIEADGKVSTATGSGLAKVDQCIAKVIAAIVFPKPTTGAALEVSYPFVLKVDAADANRPAHPRAVPTVSIGQPNAQGDLDKAIIRRYIKRNIQKIQYCYEKRLLDNPKLAGTVQTQFFISVDGKVTQSTGTGVDPDVATCIADVIKSIEFPKPKGNGGVQVNYPFTFRPAGDDSKP